MASVARTANVLVALLTAACGGSETGTATDSTPVAASQTPTLRGVVGMWTDTTLDMPALLVNGAQWNGSTDAAQLGESARVLFGTSDSTLLATWTTTDAFPVAVSPEIIDFASGTLRVQFNMLGGASDQNLGIVFGLRPNGEYHYLRYNTKDGNVALWQFINGKRQVIHHGDVHKQLPLGQWHELVVTIDGANVRGHIAGDTTISVSHTLPAAPVGRVGVWVKRDAVTAVRGFSVDRSQ
jgi:hypothetical protein